MVWRLCLALLQWAWAAVIRLLVHVRSLAGYDSRWWPWLVAFLVGADVWTIGRAIGVEFSVDVLFWSYSTAVQGFLAALAFAALIGWEQTALLRKRIGQLIDKHHASLNRYVAPLLVPASDRPPQGGVVSWDAPLQDMIRATTCVLSGGKVEDADKVWLRTLNDKQRSLGKLRGAMMSQAVVTGVLVTLCLFCMPFAEELSSTFPGSVSLSALCGLGFTCIVLTVYIAYYSIGPGRGNP